MREFAVPLIVFLGILLYLALIFFKLNGLAQVFAVTLTLLGSFELFKKSVLSILKKQFALDYIAILAILLALFTHENLVAMILALMISSGRNLEKYAQNRAKKTLTALTERIPDRVTYWVEDHPGKEVRLKDVRAGEEIFVKKGEVIPLDGILLSKTAVLDESTLTGEAQFVEKVIGDQIFSGTINMGAAMALKVTKPEKMSVYNKILEMVKKAQEEKSPMVRMADRYSSYFTIITLAIALTAFIFSRFDLMRVLAVLAIATPCPLIIATPIALLGGVNAAARHRVIIKRLSALEALARINVLVFDKTGTLTVGRPVIKKITVVDGNFNQQKVLGIASAIERNSLHPLAKAVVEFAKKRGVLLMAAHDVVEEIGKGIAGVVDGQKFFLTKGGKDGIVIELQSSGRTLALLEFEDEIKTDSQAVILFFKKIGKEMMILTGDRESSARRLVQALGEDVEVKAELKPEEKLREVEKLQKNGKVVAMVGDGINDAPALAASDVGIVFSNEEQTAASEAADIVFLGGEFASIPISYAIARKTLDIAKQSIMGGIGMSIAGMILASSGLISPILGAALQEIIDVAVILNAIRASNYKT